MVRLVLCLHFGGGNSCELSGWCEKNDASQRGNCALCVAFSADSLCVLCCLHPSVWDIKIQIASKRDRTWRISCRVPYHE